MKQSTKAVLISALIFPGLGHLALRPRRGARGLLFLVPAAAGVLYLLSTVMTLSDQLLTEINHGALALDPEAIVARTQQASAGNPALDWISLVCMVCWIAAIVDVIWLSRRVPA